MMRSVSIFILSTLLAVMVFTPMVFPPRVAVAAKECSLLTDDPPGHVHPPDIMDIPDDDGHLFDASAPQAMETAFRNRNPLPDLNLAFLPVHPLALRI